MHNWILDKLEKKLGLNLRLFLKNFSYMFANNIVTIIFALALSVMLARVLSREVFGQYNFIISIMGMIFVLSLPGINHSINRSCARGFDGSFIKGTKTRVRWSALGSLALFLIGLYYFAEGSFLLSFGFMTSALFFISYYSFRTYQFFLLSKKRFKRYSAYLSAITIIANLTTMIVAYYFRNLVIIIFVLLGLTSLINALLLFKTIRERKNDRVDKDSIPYGKHLTLVNVISVIRTYFDKILVAFFLGFEALAIYSIAIIIPRQVKPLWEIITNMVFPDLSRKNKKDAYSAVRKRFKYMLLLEVFIIIIGIIILPPIISYFYSQKYVEAIFYAQLLMIFTIAGPGLLLVNLATAQRQLRKVYKITTIPPIINIILLALLTPLYGLVGACVATVIGAGFIPLVFTWFIIFGGKGKG